MIPGTACPKGKTLCPCLWLTLHPVRIMDVGGQKSEQRKWICCFESGIALIYLASVTAAWKPTARRREAHRLCQEVLAKGACRVLQAGGQAWVGNGG